MVVQYTWDPVKEIQLPTVTLKAMSLEEMVVLSIGMPVHQKVRLSVPLSQTILLNVQVVLYIGVVIMVL